MWRRTGTPCVCVCVCVCARVRVCVRVCKGGGAQHARRHQQGARNCHALHAGSVGVACVHSQPAACPLRSWRGWWPCWHASRHTHQGFFKRLRRDLACGCVAVYKHAERAQHVGLFVRQVLRLGHDHHKPAQQGRRAGGRQAGRRRHVMKGILRSMAARTPQQDAPPACAHSRHEGAHPWTHGTPLQVAAQSTEPECCLGRMVAHSLKSICPDPSMSRSAIMASTSSGRTLIPSSSISALTCRENAARDRDAHQTITSVRLPCLWGRSRGQEGT